jgi:hypothetical protein
VPRTPSRRLAPVLAGALALALAACASAGSNQLTIEVSNTTLDDYVVEVGAIAAFEISGNDGGAIVVEVPGDVELVLRRTVDCSAVGTWPVRSGNWRLAIADEVVLEQVEEAAAVEQFSKVDPCPVDLF